MHTILIADDDQDILRLLEIQLTSEGYNVIKATDGMQALKLACSEKISLAVLDIMMPNMDGIEVCRRIREKSNCPIMFLSAKSKDIDKVVGLSIGADDYLEKPFSMDEFIARVKAHLRRYHYLGANDTYDSSKDSAKTIQIRDLEIDEGARTVRRGGKIVNLTKTEYEILLLLAKHKGQVFSFEEIFRSVWKERYFESNNTVMVHIARLRDKLKEGNGKSEIIKNVWGVGYKIEK